MATVFTTMKGATLTFAATLAELTTTGVDVSCQISDAHVQPTPETENTGATLCTDPSDDTTGIKYSLEIVAFQDWTDPAGFCWFLQTNALEKQYFKLALLDGGDQTGRVTIVPMPYGGVAGSNLTGNVPSMGITEFVATPPAAVFTAESEAATAAA